MEKKYTKRDFYEAILNSTLDEMPQDLVKEFAQNELILLDRRRQSKKENDASIVEIIKNLLTFEYQSISDILTQINDENLTASKITYRLNGLVKEGLAEKGNISFKTEDGKTRTVVAYRKL